MSILEYFLKTGLTYALLSISEKLAVKISSLKPYIINSENISRFALIIFTRISFWWMALDASSESVSLWLSFSWTTEKLKCCLWFSRFYSFPKRFIICNISLRLISFFLYFSKLFNADFSLFVVSLCKFLKFCLQKFIV